jgi:hypothetical protein
MIEHVWTVICSSAIIDQETNNVSIFNILEQVEIPQESIVNQAMGIGVELLSLWVRADLSKPATGKSRADLVTPSGELINLAESVIDLSKFERLRSRALFQGLPYKGEGVYRFLVGYKGEDEQDWNPVASIPLKVMLIKKENK